MQPTVGCEESASVSCSIIFVPSFFSKEMYGYVRLLVPVLSYVSKRMPYPGEAGPVMRKDAII